MASSGSSCQLCASKHVLSPAIKYCSDCQENLCQQCLDVHSKFKAFLNHHLAEIKPVLEEKNASKNMCNKHFNMYLDFFCSDHDCLCCRSCMEKDHRTCEKFIPLEVASQGVKHSPMFNDVNEGIRSIEQTLNKMISNCDFNIQSLDEDEESVTKQVLSVKTNIIKRLNQLEEKLKSEICCAKQNKRVIFESRKDNLLRFKSCVEDVSNQLNQVSENGSEKQIFVLMNYCKWEQVEYEAKLQEIIPTLEESHITFQPPDDILIALKPLGSIEVKSSKCTIEYKPPKAQQVQIPINVPQIARRFTVELKIEIQRPGDVWITGIAMTDDKRLLVCNRYSTDLLVYSYSADYLQDCKLSGQPWDIAVIPGENKAVVTLPDQKAIQFMNIKKMKASFPFPVPGRCLGVAVVNDEICVGGDGGYIYILDKRGSLKTEIKVPSTTSVLFYLHPGPFGCICYTDNAHNATGCVTLNGEELFRYSSKDLCKPEAVKTDVKGNLYISCRGSNNIQRLTPDGKFLDVINVNEHDFKCPYGMTFSHDFLKLFVSYDNRKIVIFSCSL